METQTEREELSRKQFFFWGWMFAGLEILAVIRNVSTHYFSFYWFCDFAPALYALCFLSRRAQAVKGLIYIGLLGQLGYIVVVVARLLLGKTLFGFTIDFPLTPAYLTPTIIVHMATLFALMATYKVRPKKSSLVYSLFFLTMIYATVLLFAPRGPEITENFNFIFHTSLFGGSPLYTKLWIPLAFVVVVLPTYGLDRLIFYLYGRFRSRALSEQQTRKVIQNRKQHEGFLVDRLKI